MRFLRSTFSTKLAFLFCSLVALSVSISGYLIHQLIQKQYISDLTNNLTKQAALLASQLEPDFMQGLPGHASQRVLQFENICDCRVTFIRPDGKVMEDSDVPTNDLDDVENHANRPEIKSALLGAAGSSVRHSQTVNVDMLYTAVPLWMGSDVAGVVRLALPLTDINTKLSEIRYRVFAIALGMMVAAWFLSMLLARSVSRPVQELSIVAERLGQGQFEARVRRPGQDELGQLGHAFNSLAEKVESQIEIISEEKSQLSAVLSNMTDGVVVVDAEGRVVMVNPALSSFFGVDAVASQGKYFIEVLRESKLSEILARVREALNLQVDEVRTVSGDERIFEVHGVPILNEGVYAGAMLVLHDITKIRRLEQVRRDFIANVSHELRTPLAAIKGFAETLLSGGLEDVKNRTSFVKAIEQHSNRMATLVGDLLDLTAIESGQRPPQKKMFSISELMDDVMAEFATVAQKKKVALDRVALEKGLVITADRGQIQQVVTNLVENALKFTGEGGRVGVSARAMGQQIELSVKDSGIGIPSQDLPRIFERFYRVDKARSREMGGTGLGLSIVKHIVEAHGGSVRVESHIGKGSVFTVSLPIN